MLHFNNDTILPIEAALTMGISTKDETQIGMFGTGLKYAIAGILRRNGRVSIRIGYTDHKFGKRPTTIRGKEFDIVTCNGKDCGYSTDLGKHWEAWQLFRELASNCLDEGGMWGEEDLGLATCVSISCEEVERSEKEQRVFLKTEGFPLIESGDIEVFGGASYYYYNNGIRCGSFVTPIPYTINLKQARMSEDRTVDRFTLNFKFSRALSYPQQNPEEIAKVLVWADDNNYIANDVLSMIGGYDSLDETLMGHIVNLRKSVKNGKLRSFIHAYLKDNGKGYEEVEPCLRTKNYTKFSEKICGVLGIPLPEVVKLSSDLPDDVLGITDLNNRSVWISDKVVAMGREEFAVTYLEEAIHASTGLTDESRGLQEYLLKMLVSGGETLLER